MKTKILIIGSGPAGYSAAIYTARAGLNPTLIQGYQAGGQLMITTEIENYPGFAKPIGGAFLMEQMEKQAENVGVNIVMDAVSEVDFSNRPFICKTDGGQTYEAESVIIATGAGAKWLGIPSEEKYQGFGVSGCATCDGAFFKGVPVAVVGGGDTAVEEAIYLTKHASKVYIVHRRDELRAEKIMQEKLFANPKIEPVWNVGVEEILGTEKPNSVTGLRLKNTVTGEVSELAVEGVFIAIGHKPNTDLFKGQVELDNDGYIITAPDSTKTSVEGVFAAGDVQDKVYRQAIVAAGSGCMASLEVAKFLE